MDRLLGLLLIVVSACGGDDGVVALFELPGAESDFYALPFPNDLRRDADGTISLTGHPIPNDLTGDYLDVIDASVTGFSLSPVTFFRFDGVIDADSLPATPEASRAADASVYLVGIEPGRRDYGVRIPLRLRFEHSAGSVIGEDWLAVQTYPGFVLEEDATYATVVTKRLTAGGKPVRRDADFREVLDGDVYRPLVDYLSDSGTDGLADVVSAAVFTTQDATSLLMAARDVVRSQPQPGPRDVSLVTTTTAYAQYQGLWDAPNFQAGDPPYRRTGGDVQVDGDGVPVVQRSEELRFALTVPLGDPPADGWPVVLYAHGTGGSYTSFVSNGIARDLAEAGLAGLSMDQVLHGPRDPTGSSPDLNFFNFLNPAAARDNTIQGAIDLLNLTRLAEVFDYDDVGASRHIAFDGDRIAFFGHSQGGITGMPFLGTEPTVKGAVLSGAGGLLYLGLLLKTEPVDITALIATVIRDEPLDEFNPVLALLQTYLDRADGANYARYVIREPRAGTDAKNVLMGEGFVDRFTPPPSIEALAVALGVEQAEPILAPIEGLALRGIGSRATPIADNVDGVTAVLVQHQEVEGSDGHFIFFDVPEARNQAVEFLQSLAETGTAQVP